MSDITIDLGERRARPRHAVQPPGTKLTAAEQAVLTWLAVDRNNAQIAQCQGRSERAVRNQLTRVYAKIGVANRAEGKTLRPPEVGGANLFPDVLENGQYVVEASGNLIDGGAGNDYISAGTGTDIVHGGDEDDDIEGLDGADGSHNNNGTPIAGLMLRTPITDRAWQTGCRMLHSRGA